MNSERQPNDSTAPEAQKGNTGTKQKKDERIEQGTTDRWERREDEERWGEDKRRQKGEERREKVQRTYTRVIRGKLSKPPTEPTAIKIEQMRTIIMVTGDLKKRTKKRQEKR